MGDQNKYRFIGFISILYLIFVIITSVLILIDIISGSRERTILNYFLSILSPILQIILLSGFIMLSTKLNLKFLKTITYVTIVFTILVTIFDLIIPYSPTELSRTFFSSAVLFINGPIAILWGISVIPLKNKFGGTATAIGILSIIAGATLITYILSFIGMLLTIPAVILESILFFRASKILK